MTICTAVIQKKQAVDPLIHQKVMELFRLYLIVGGMPAAVVFHGGNVSVKDKITYYPIYMMMFLREPDLAQDLTYTPDFGALMG